MGTETATADGSGTLGQPDYRSRTREGVARLFEFFASHEAPQLDAPLYEHLCRAIATDPDLLDMAARAPLMQPPPNLLLAAAHYLLLRSERHELREWYATLNGGRSRDPASAFPVFREFCLARRERIVDLIETRLTQTNVIGRTSGLLPALARVFAQGGGRPLALIEIGPSAGLNLQWYRFRYRYRRESASGRECERNWGPPDSPVLVEAQSRGAALPELPDAIPVAWRRGIDIHPIAIDDEDAITWLRALVWPDHRGRQERLSAAIGIARRDSPLLIEGDAAQRLPDLMAAAPPDTTLCVYGTHTLYQFPIDSIRAVFKAMKEGSRTRAIDFVRYEGTGDRFSEIERTAYRAGERETESLARCCPHGRWLDWIGPTA